MKTYLIEEVMARRPLDGAAERRVQEYEAQMRAEVRAYRLAQLRKERDLTQAELARQLEVSQHRVSQIERGLV